MSTVPGLLASVAARAMTRRVYFRPISLYRRGDPICVAFRRNRSGLRELMIAGVPSSVVGHVIDCRPSRKPGSVKWRIEVAARAMNGSRYKGVFWISGSWKAATPARLRVPRPTSALRLM